MHPLEGQAVLATEPFLRPYWHRRTRALSRKIFRTTRRDLVLLLALSILGEWGVRFCLPQTAQGVFGPTVTGGHSIILNSHGLRDVEFEARRGPHEHRILCLGDSTTFGAGVGADETYPKQLEKRLNHSRPNTRWLVINGGGQGASVSQQTDFLLEKGLSFDPSLIVLGFSPSMLGVAAEASRRAAEQPQAQPGPSWKRWGLAAHHVALSLHARLHQSYLYVSCVSNVRRFLFRHGILRDRMDYPTGAVFAYAFRVPGVNLAQVEEAYRVFEGELVELQGIFKTQGNPLVVLGIPSRFRISNDRRDNERGYDLGQIRIEPLERVAAICRRRKIPFVDLTPRLARERVEMAAGRKPWDDLYIPLDYAHLNTTGMAIAAEEVEGSLPAAPFQDF